MNRLATAALIAVAGAAGWGSATLPAGAQQQAQPPEFRAGVDVVSLSVTVTDLETRFVTDLEPDDFAVYEDGIRQEINFFTRTQLPIALALLIDTSASMDEEMGTAQEAAIGFSQRLGPDDLAEIIDFDSRVDVLQGFTNDVDELESAIRRTSAGGSTSLYNALYISLKDLTRAPLREADVRREAIIVLSDGEDTSSLVSFEEVLELAKRSETAIYSIGLQSEDRRARTGFREADFVLRQLAQETGGRAFFPDEVSELPDIYRQISDELSSQYSVGYISANPLRNGQWRRIVVQVEREGATARTKRGYYAPRG
ncbi:MAG: VWA domain-containing protein [Acidobacteria bacterium]|nr:VWA domain-containing protein [Acidobacteriota bacterium]